jgi:hypothetical protein
LNQQNRWEEIPACAEKGYMMDAERPGNFYSCLERLGKPCSIYQVRLKPFGLSIGTALKNPSI